MDKDVGWVWTGFVFQRMGDHWQTLVNIVMSLLVPRNKGNFLTN